MPSPSFRCTSLKKLYHSASIVLNYYSQILFPIQLVVKRLIHFDRSYPARRHNLRRQVVLPVVLVMGRESLIFLVCFSLKELFLDEDIVTHPDFAGRLLI